MVYVTWKEYFKKYYYLSNNITYSMEKIIL